jgi:hypothetical protein
MRRAVDLLNDIGQLVFSRLEQCLVSLPACYLLLREWHLLAGGKSGDAVDLGIEKGVVAPRSNTSSSMRIVARPSRQSSRMRPLRLRRAWPAYSRQLRRVQVSAAWPAMLVPQTAR